MVSGRHSPPPGAAGSTQPPPVHRQVGNLIALLLQILGGVEDGVVLKGSGNDVGLSPRLSPAGGGENGLVVRLAATRGKVDLLRPAVKAVRHGLPGLCQGFSGLLAQGVQGGGIAVCFPQVGEHGVQAVPLSLVVAALSAYIMEQPPYCLIPTKLLG